MMPTFYGNSFSFNLVFRPAATEVFAMPLLDQLPINLCNLTHHAWVKFRYSEKATQIWSIFFFLFDITYLISSNYKWKMGQIFVAFSEYLNFICPVENHFVLINLFFFYQMFTPGFFLFLSFYSILLRNICVEKQQKKFYYVPPQRFGQPQTTLFVSGTLCNFLTYILSFPFSTYFVQWKRNNMYTLEERKISIISIK